MKSFVKGLEVIGNNIANVNTTGFKGQRTNYNDSFSLTLTQAQPGGGGASNKEPVQIGTGVTVESTQRNFDPGPVSQTGIPSDLAIIGNGFFQVRDADGVDYVTRNGAFRANSEGYLVTQGGQFLQGFGYAWDAGWDPASGTPPTGALDETQTTAIRVNNPDDPMNRAVEAWSIGSDGNVNIFLDDGSSYVGGRILLRDFNNPGALTAAGNGLFRGFEIAGPIGDTLLAAASEGGTGSIQAGALESSNVDLTEEFAAMITAQRSFQAGSRLITMSDEILQEMVNLKR